MLFEHRMRVSMIRKQKSKGHIIIFSVCILSTEGSGKYMEYFESSTNQDTDMEKADSSVPSLAEDQKQKLKRQRKLLILAANF